MCWESYAKEPPPTVSVGDGLSHDRYGMVSAPVTPAPAAGGVEDADPAE
jgi:hypothetical protein